MMESVNNTMLFTAIVNQEKGKFHNFIVPLADIKVEKDKKTKLTTHVKLGTDISGKYEGVVLSVSDDPYTRHADDWAHLGCFKLGFVLKNAQLLVKRDRIQVICENKDFLKKNFIPDRWI